MALKLRRLDDDKFVLTDDEVALVMTGSSESPKLFGLAFKTVTACWRVLRFGAVDIGHAPDADAGVSRLLEDADRRQRRAL
jgi:hypothetical protein